MSQKIRPSSDRLITTLLVCATAAMLAACGGGGGGGGTSGSGAVAGSVATGALNDTGIDWCTENITTPNMWVNHVVCSTFSWVGNLWGQQQDAFYGRDAQAKAGTLTKVGGGMAGFDFTKIGASGQVLANQVGTYSDSGTEAEGTLWDCVRDNVTGLVWEVKRNDLRHLRHLGHGYAWYNPDSATNGGAAGSEVPQSGANASVVTGPTCTDLVDSSKCNTQSYVAAVNAVGLCGKKDWRLPTVDELRNLVHNGHLTLGAAIDTNYFPNTAADWTWSSSPYASTNSFAWGVDFFYGDDFYADKKDAYRVRLVRSGQ